MNLKHLSDKQLLIDIKNHVNDEFTSMVLVLYHLKEIEERKLYSDLKFASLYEYAIKELKYSEQEASRRIQSARLLIEFPELGKKIEKKIHSLSNLYMVSKFFKKEDITDNKLKIKILSSVENTTSRECERILFTFTEKPLPKESIQQVSTNHLQLKINITTETHQKLEEVKALLAFHDIDDAYFSKLAEEARENIHRKRFKLTDRGRITSSTQWKMPSNHERRTVFISATDKVCSICGGLFYLQEDHIIPKARGGSNDPSNLRLLCFNCNQRQRIKAKL